MALRAHLHSPARHAQALERALSFYDEASGVPVLLSMLVLVFSNARSATEALPQSRLELYRLSMQAAIQRRFGGKAVASEAALKMLAHVAVAAHAARLREFDGALVAAALPAGQRALWERLAAEEDGVPLIKSLELGSEDVASSKFQARHLSFQEALLAGGLIKRTAELPAQLRQGGPHALLEDKWFQNAFRIGGGALGEVIGAQFAEARELKLSEAHVPLLELLEWGVLRGLRALLKLDLSKIRMGAEQCSALAEAMQQNESCKIEELDLRENEIGAPGAKSLAAMMAVRASLTQVLAFSRY